MSDQVILEFIGDTTGLKPAADALKSLGQLDKEQAELFKKSNAEAQKLLQSQASSTKKVTDEQKKLGKELQNNTDETKDFHEQFKALTQTILEGAVETIVEDFQNLAQSEALAGDGAKSLKAQLKELKAELALMEQAGDDSSERFVEMSVRAAELEDQIGDTNARIKQLASDTRTFDLVAEGLRGITAGFSVATSATALFGNESEDLQKALLKVQAAMALASGAQELANIATTKGGIATTIATVAQKAYAIVVGESTGALKAFRVALAFTGIGALVLLITALVTNFDKLKASLGFVNADFENLNKTIQIQDELIKQLSESYDLQERRARALGASEVELANQKIKSVQAIIAAEQLKLSALNTSLNEQERVAKKELDKYSEIAKIFGPAVASAYGKIFGTEESLKNVKTVRDQVEDSKKALEEYQVQLLEAQSKLRVAIRQAFKNEKIELLELKGIDDADIDKVVNDSTISTESKVKILKAFGLSDEEVTKRLAEALQKAAVDIPSKITEGLEVPVTVKPKIDTEDTLRQVGQFAIQTAGLVSDAIFDNNQQRRQQDLEKELEFLEKKKQAELANKDLTEGQIAAINEKYRKIEAEAKKKAWKADQAAKAEQAVINGLLALTTSLSQQGYPAGLITGLLALATAGVQAGIILSKPVPEFAKGTKGSAVTPPGWKLVGEEGPELIYEPGGAKVITAPDTAKLLAAYNIPTMPALPNNVYSQSPAANQSDIQAVAIAVAEKVASMKQTNISIDKNGLTVYTVESGRKITSLNNYYEAR